MNKNITEFWRGRVVFEKSANYYNPGHVVKFVKGGTHSNTLLVQVDFADGDRIDLFPDELEFEWL